MLVAVLVVTAGVIAAGWPLTAALEGHPDSPPLLGLTATGLFVGAALLRIDVRFGAHRVAYLPLDAALILALLLVPPSWAPAVAGLGMALAAGVIRQPAIKLLFNSARCALAAFVGVGAVAFAGSGFDPATTGGLVGLLTAGLIFDLVGNALTMVVVGMAQGTSTAAVWSANAGTQAVTAGGNLALTALGLVLARVDLRLLLVLPVGALLLYQGYLVRVRGRAEREAGRRLAEAARSLSSLDERDVVRRAAAAAADLLAADVVEISLRDGTGGQTVHRHRADGGAAATGATEQLAASVPLDADGEESLGELRVYLSAYVRLVERERDALRTLAAATHTALQTARAHARTAQLAELRAYEASHDPLTRLPNRQLLQCRVDAHLDTAVDPMPAVALVLIRPDHFGEVAATLGHAARDTLLRHAATQLVEAGALGELVARLDGDQFAVFLHEATDPADVAERARALLDALATPLRLDAATVSMTGTAGIAYAAPDQPASAGELLRQASVALERASRIGTGVDFYQPAQDATGPGSLLLSAELRTALAEGQLVLHYQPMVDLNTGAPVAAEAVVHWRHPSRGLLAPRDFLTVLESSSLLPAYTDWLLREALAECREWSALDLEVPVSVNLSARSLLDRELPGRVAAALARARLGPERLMVELTESSALSPIDTVDVVLEDLRVLGVRVAVDDFGTGHSSLTRLLRVPATDLKIAPQFVEGMLISPQARTIVRTAIEIAQSYDLRAIAVGVRTAAHAAAVRNLGGHAGQGDHCLPPMLGVKARAAMRLAANGAQLAPAADVIPLRRRRRTDPGW
ncbi:MAG: putative bifunctional diguanylate cyclase/phosphodiesterase [Mycobacteriales bacterium]